MNIEIQWRCKEITIMIIAIYEVAMYEIVSMIKKACPTYDFFSVPEENGYQENNETVDAIFQ